MNEQTIILQTKKWVKDVVIGLNFCPFAKAPFDREEIRFVVAMKEQSIEQFLQKLLHECIYLDQHLEIETTLIVFPQLLTEYYSYLDFADLANDCLEDQEYDGVYQLATFHPAYVFEGASADDPANYTNRSPYPMIHLIRESSIDAALKSYKKPELIPERNVKVARELGLEKMQKLFNDSF